MTTAVETPIKQTLAPAGRWTVDPRHSAVEFSVKHLMIATIKGRFGDFEGALDVQEMTGDVHGHGVVKVESIDTAEPGRDGHLLSADFFDVERFPEIRFTVRRIEPVAGNRFRVHGQVMVRGVRRELSLDAIVSAVARDPVGDERLALDLTGALSRKDFGLRWNQVVEAGPVAGDEVRLAISLSLVRQGDHVRVEERGGTGVWTA
jgi:polyisoprenoid-binding protein YceI